MNFFVKNRIMWSRIFVIVLIILLFISSFSWSKHSLTYFMLKWGGFVLVVIATFGRLWCSIYISGYKEDKIINEGPYSVARNPLYIFSFIGAMGLGMSTANILILFFIFILFTFFYPSVVSHEEKILQEKHGKIYDEYIKSTPKWFPNFSNYKRPKEYLVQLKQIENETISCMWFLWFFLIFHIIEILHEIEYLPVLIKVP